MKALKIGAISFLNAKPIFYGIEKGYLGKSLKLSYDLPADSSEKVALGILDVAIVPTIQYARLANLKIVPGISIASVGSVGSVNLFCKTPLERIKQIAVDQRSRTSVALLKILCKELYNIDVKFTPMPPEAKEMLTSCDAALIIGDDALYYQGEAEVVRDLSSDWYELTGLPFVFAFLAGRSTGFFSEHTRSLQKSLATGLENVEEIARKHVVPGIDDIETINIRYLRENINYQLGVQHLEGLKLFYTKATELGLIESVPELRFYDEE